MPRGWNIIVLLCVLSMGTRSVIRIDISHTPWGHHLVGEGALRPRDRAGGGEARGGGGAGGGRVVGGGERSQAGHPRARVVDAGQDPQPIARTNALAPPERAEPPSFQASCVLLEDGEHVVAAEGQLVRRLCHVVVHGPCCAVPLHVGVKTCVADHHKKISTIFHLYIQIF